MKSLIPEGFKDYACKLLGEERYACFSRALADVSPASVRLNPSKALKADLQPGNIWEYDGPIPWASEEGVYLKERPLYTADPLFHAGAYYVQEASSMFLKQALRRYVTNPVVALDLCAAPGGKSTHLRALLPEGSLLVSNEPVRARAQVLLENLVKWGHPDIFVTNSYPVEFAALPDFFDLLVADVPCSGEGMFRKEEEAVSGWSMEQVMMCRDRQRDILRDVWPALKPGGLLVYSTCTLNTYENEENVAWIVRELGAEVLALEIDPDWSVIGNLLQFSGVDAFSVEDTAFPVFHLVPGMVRGEGFFLAVLRKTSDGQPLEDGEKGCRRRKTRMSSKKTVGALPEECRSWLSMPDEFDFRKEGDTWVACRSSFSQHLDLLRRSVNVWQSGIPIAMEKGKSWMPLHSLAMSSALNPLAFPSADLSYEDAVSYLRRETLVLPSDVPKGFVLLTYQNLPLGFVKNVGGRANNLYPSEWKIRMSRLDSFSLKRNER